jgi:hypothetical protein
MNSVGEVRLTGAAGVAFSILFFVYLVLVDAPDMTSSADQAVAFYQDSGERSTLIVGGYMAGLAGVLFLLLVVGVRDVRALGRETEALVAPLTLRAVSRDSDAVGRSHTETDRCELEEAQEDGYAGVRRWNGQRVTPRC